MATTKRKSVMRGVLPLNSFSQRLISHELKNEKLRAQLQAQAQELLKTLVSLPGAKKVSFADVCRVKCDPKTFVPSKVVPLKVVVAPLRHDITRREARRDYALAYDAVLEQRRSNNEMVAAITARYAKQAVLKAPKRLTRAQAVASAKAFSQARKQESRRNAYLIACITFRYAEKYNEEEHAPTVEGFSSLGNGGVEKSIRGPCKAKRTLKVKSPVPKEDWDKEISLMKSVPFQGLVVEVREPLNKAFSKTLCARYLWGALLTKLFEYKGEAAMERLESYSRKEIEEAEPQMDEIEISSGNSAPKSSAQSTAVDDDKVVCEKVATPSQGFYESSSSMETQNFNTFTSRWIYVGKFMWQSSSTEGYQVYSLNILNDIVKNNMDSQALAVMLSHRFYRTDVRVRCSLNSNVFQVGKLVIGYVYQDEYTSSNAYSNLWTTLQRPHAVLLAGQNMGAELVIPYRNVHSSMSLRDKDSFAKLLVFVHVPLSAGEKTVNSCTVSVHVTLENSSFNGLCKRMNLSEVAVAEPQMEAIESIANMTLDPSISNAVNVATSVLKTVGADHNRDLPPVPLQPMSFVPQATGSLCYTNNILEPVNALRGDASGQVPKCYPEDEMSISYLCRKWGLLKSQIINFSTDGFITSIPVVPLHSTSVYRSSGTYQGLAYCTPPPIAAVASLYTYFRGEIEFKFEFVASSYHKAKIMVSCVPYPNITVNYPIDDVKFSANKIYDISSPGDKIFTAPWQWKDAFCPVRGKNFTVDVPAMLYVHIVNQALAIAQVPQNITMNIYIRAGPSFELAIQRPSVFTLFNGSKIIPPVDQILNPYNTEGAQYLSYHSGCVTADGKYPLVPTIQNVVNGFTGYTNLVSGVIYHLEHARDNSPYRFLTSDGNVLEYATYDVAISTANAHGLIVDTLPALKAYILEKDPVVARSKLKTFWKADGPWSQIQKNGKWIPAANDNYPVWKAYVESFEIIEPEMEEPEVVSLVSHPTPTSSGLRIFGEECPDLKSYCHRYHALGTMKVEGRSIGLPMNAACSGVIRVHPRRTVEPQHSSDNENRWGSGGISLISGWYRFWRGSIRYKFVVIGSPPAGTCMYVSYCHDQYASGNKTIQLFDSQVRTRDDLLNTLYPTYVHNLSINSVFTVEVPFYNQRECLSLYPVSSKLFNSDNGILKFFLMSLEKCTVHIDVLYSMGDDFRFYSFSGIPQLFDLSDMAPEPVATAEPQMEEVEVIRADPEGKRENFLTKSCAYVSGVINAPRQLGESIKKATEAHASLCGDVKVTLEKCKKLGNDFSDKVKDIFSQTSESVSALSWADLLGNLTSTAFEVVSHIIYAIIGGTKMVICWAIFNILRTVFGLSFQAYSTVSSFVSKTWGQMTSLIQRTQGSDEPQMEDEDIVGYGTLLFTTMATFCSVKVTNLCSPHTWANGLFAFSKCARSGSQVGAFLRDNLTFITRAFKSLMGMFGRNDKDFNLIAGVEDTRLKRWLVEVSCLLAPANAEKIAKSPSWIQKVFELSMVGRALSLSVVLKNSRANPIANLVNSYMKELRNLETQLVHKRVYSSTRYEPFCLWIAGEAGAGKSTFGVDCCDEFGKSVEYTGACSYHPMIPGVKYVDGTDDQPSWFFDDTLSLGVIEDPLFIPIYLCGKSPCILRLPFSRVEDKDRLVNMRNLVYVSNILNFNNVTGIHNIPAFNRRRDLVLKFKFRNGWDEGIVRKRCLDAAKVKSVEDMEHVWVDVLDPLTDKRLQKIVTVPGESYKTTVMKVVMTHHNNYHARQTETYERKHRKVQENILRAESSGQCFDDYIKSYIQTFEKLEQEFKSEYDVETPATMDPGLAEWLQKCKEASGAEKAEADPHMPDVDVKCIYTHKRTTKTSVDWFESDVPCVHTKVDPRNVIFPNKGWIRPGNQTIHANPGCPFGPCTVKRNGQSFDNVCCWNDPVWKADFLYKCATCIPGDVKHLNSLIEDEWHKYPKELEDLVLPCEPQVSSAPMEEEIDGIQGKFRSAFKMVGKFAFDVGKEILGFSLQVIVMLVAVFTIIYKVLRVIALIVIGVSVLSKMFSGIFGSSKQEPQLAHSGDYTTIKSARTIRQRTLQLVKSGPEFSEIEVEKPSNLDGILRKISKNTVILMGLKRQGDDVLRMKARCTGLHGRTVLFVRHYYDYFVNNGFNRVGVASRKGACYTEYNLSELVFEWAKGGGYGTCTLPPSYPTMFSDITNLICSEKYGGYYPVDGILLENGIEDTMTTKLTFSLTKGIVDIPDKNGSGAWSIEPGQAFVYGYGGRGKCGSLLLAPSLSSPILGVHTSGNGSTKGYAEVLRRETFKPNELNLEFVEPHLEDADNVYGLDGFYSQEGALERPVSSGTETSIRPSDIQGVFPVTTEPAPLKGSDPRLSENTDIFKIGVSKRCQPTIEFPIEDVKEATKHFTETILEQVKPMRTPVLPLSVAEAIEGLPIAGMAAPIRMSTAEGFPWKEMRPAGAANKSWMFDMEHYEDGRYRVKGILRDLQETLDWKMELRSIGKIPCSYFTASLKDSRILKEKVSIPGKTRIFEISPIELTIAQRQMFYDYISAYVESRVEHTIGINPDGPEWSQLANELTSFSECILTADYAAFGPRAASRILEIAFDVANVWMDKYEEGLTEEEKDTRFLIREALKYEVSKGLHVARDLVFRPSSGLPSGNCETVNKNSQINSLYIRIAFLGLARKYAPQYADLYWFHLLIKMFSNGDDLIISVKKHIIGWFNNVTLIEFFAGYDIKMTDALKNGQVRPFCSIEEATYLKRGFARHPTRPGQWLAPLERSSVTDTANWINKSPDTLQASLVNSESCSRLAYTLGPEEYELISSTLKSAWALKDIRFVYPKWDTLDRHVWEGTEGPKYSF